MLTDTQQKLWEAYEAAESLAPRSEKLRVLDQFLNALAASPQAEWFPWARTLAEQVVDEGLKFLIRRPLFDQAIFPALLAGFKSQLPGCTRWLAGLAHHIERNPSCRDRLPPECLGELGLLLAAVKQDPDDRRSRVRLINIIADRLCHSIHELPSGVLYGMNGASPDQCLELEAELADFCALVAKENMQDRFAELIDHCRLHFTGYRDYLPNRKQYDSYSAYISRHFGESG